MPRCSLHRSSPLSTLSPSQNQQHFSQSSSLVFIQGTQTISDLDFDIYFSEALVRSEQKHLRKELLGLSSDGSTLPWPVHAATISLELSRLQSCWQTRPLHRGHVTRDTWHVIRLWDICHRGVSAQVMCAHLAHLSRMSKYRKYAQTSSFNNTSLFISNCQFECA